MAKKIKWTKRASLGLSHVIEYLELKWGAQVTEAFVKRTFDVVELLSSHPELGTLENKEKKIRGFLITKHNKLFYRITDQELVVLNLFDTRSNPKKKRY